MEESYRGIFVVMHTPFTKEGSVDVPGLRNLVEVTIQAGCHGIIALVNSGETSLLNDAEHAIALETILDQASGRVPTIAGITGKTDRQGIEYAKHAQASGAQGIMSMPPYVAKCSPPEAIAYYKKIDAAIEIPIFIQNFFAPLGTPMTSAQLYTIISECDNVQYIKEESDCPSQVTTDLLQMLKEKPIPRFKGLFSGLGGNMMLHELSRGNCGMMPAPHLTDVFVDMWNLWETGQVEELRNLHQKVLPLLIYESTYAISVWKAICWYRGFIDCPDVRRGAGIKMSKQHYTEYTRYMEVLKPHLRSGCECRPYESAGE